MTVYALEYGPVEGITPIWEWLKSLGLGDLVEYNFMRGTYFIDGIEIFYGDFVVYDVDTKEVFVYENEQFYYTFEEDEEWLIS